MSIDVGRAVAPLGQQLPEDPYPTYERLLAVAPIVRYANGWAVLGYQAARQILQNDSFLASTAPRETVDRLADRTGHDFSVLTKLHDCILFYLDPPAHGPARRLLARQLNRYPAEALRTAVEAIIARQLQRARRDGGFDLVRDFARPIPAFVMSKVLGLPESDLPELAHNSEVFVELFDLMIPFRSYLRVNEAARFLFDYFMTLVRKRRASPGDDGISKMIRETASLPNITDTELAGYCAFMLIAGQETTANFIAGGAATLFQNPAAVAKLCAEPDRLPQAAEDLLRYHSPVQWVGRTASVDSFVAGVRVNAGDRLSVFLGAANRDPAVFPSSACPVLDGRQMPHLAFADGRHLCIGAALARLEGSRAFAGLLTLPGIRLDRDNAVWSVRRNLRGLARLPVML